MPAGRQVGRDTLQRRPVHSVHAGREGVAVRDERTQDVAEPLIGE